MRGAQVAWVMRIRLDLATKTSNRNVHSSSQRGVLIPPDEPEQFITRDDLPGPRREVSQDLDFAQPQVDFLAIPVGT